MLRQLRGGLRRFFGAHFARHVTVQVIARRPLGQTFEVGYPAFEIAVDSQVDGGAPYLVGDLLAVLGFGQCLPHVIALA